jgi:hypothetical protein
MSAETCVYILKNKKLSSDQFEYRIHVARAVDNIFFEDSEWISETFSNCTLTTSEKIAISHAEHLDRIYETEYGVSLIKTFENQSFEMIGQING